MRLLEYNLKKEGFAVESVTTGTDALEKVRKAQFDLVVLDLMLPEMDGYEVIKRIRADKEISSVPVIMLTARSEEVDRVLGLELGADDYVTKPFSLRELIARVRAVLRRTAESVQKDTGIIRRGELLIDLESYQVKRGTEVIELGAKEFKLLGVLASKPGKVFSRERLLDEVWGDEVFVEPRTVDVHIRRLREKIEPDPSRPVYILTKRGLGYFFSGEGS